MVPAVARASSVPWQPRARTRSSNRYANAARPQAQLITRQIVRAHFVGFQLRHLLLEHVSHLPARAIKLLEEPDRREARAIRVAFKAFGRQIRHEEARVVVAGQHFGFADHPPRPAPARQRAILELGKLPHAGRAAETGAHSRGGRRRRQVFEQHRVFSQPRQ